MPRFRRSRQLRNRQTCHSQRTRPLKCRAGAGITSARRIAQATPRKTEIKERSMNIERKPVAYGDLRGWIKALHAAGEIREIDAEVDWNIEIGTVMRLAQGTGDGPALMFNNIKDYGANARCRRVFGCGLASYRRIAMMLGVAADTHPRELVKLGRNVLNGSIAPKIVSTGPVKENIVTGDDIDLYELPSPWWNRLDGGRYLLTYGGCVTKDHDTGVMNVGIYRGMVASKNEILILMWRDFVLACHLAAINADVHHAGVVVLGRS